MVNAIPIVQFLNLHQQTATFRDHLIQILKWNYIQSYFIRLHLYKFELRIHNTHNINSAWHLRLKPQRRPI
jgi:hypothetical protein